MRRAASMLLVGVLVALFVECRDATEIVLELRSPDCARVRDTRIFVAESSEDVEHQVVPRAETSDSCEAGLIGTLVLCPANRMTATVAVRVRAGIDDECSSHEASCVDARRVLRFVPHTSLRLPITITASCKGQICNASTTCENGTCAASTIDPGTCGGGACELPPASDAGPDGSAPDDARAVDGEPPDGAPIGDARAEAGCTSAGTGSVPCGKGSCDTSAGQVCCDSTISATPQCQPATDTCQAGGVITSTVTVCDEASDCPTGEVCCIVFAVGGQQLRYDCVAAGACANGGQICKQTCECSDPTTTCRACTAGGSRCAGSGGC